MAETQTLNSSDADSCCVVCFKNVDIHSIGSCDHPVCFECSTRLRVLCESMECPICRQDMPKVIFTREVKPYSELITISTDQNLVVNSRGIYFCSAPLKRRYDRLLEHECQICKKNAKLCLFSTFNQLKDHVRKTHDLYFCPLCVTNLKIFTFERRCYTRSELATHNRKGDPDDTSHRGHPLCEFCTNHFMDNDELYRHLRRDHCYCHFCDADGKHQYYNTLRDLRKHYLDEHYVCEEGECRTERYTSVFRSDIDLKAHYTSVHGRYLGKAAARQARTLDIEFTLKPRRTGNNAGEFSRPPSGFQEHEVHFTTTNSEFRDTEETTERERGVTCNILSTENFPALGSALGGAPPISISTFNSKTNPNPFRRENFPSLGGSNSNSSRAPSVTITGKFNIQNSKNGAHKKQPTTTNSTTFAFASGSGNKVREPTSQDLPKPTENKPLVNRANNGNYGQVVSVRPKLEDFPQLGGSAAPTQQSTAWVAQKQSKKVEPKVNKVAPAPKLPSNNNENFPTLGGKSAKGGEKNRVSTSVTIPVSDSWVNLNSFNNHTKVNGGASVSKLKSEKQTNNKQKNNENIVKNSKPAEMTSTNENFKFVSVDNLSRNKKKKGKNANEKPVDKQAVNVENLNMDNPPKTPNGKKRSELNVEVREPDANNVSKPPPGFNVKPPPGFNNFVLSNNLTFTNSSGQSYSIVPSEQFYPPLNFKSRNQSLIKKFMTVLNDPTAIQQFKVYSDMFRAGEIPAEKYYEHCERIMDIQFDFIFPELLVLLPNIEKQQNLYRIYQDKRGNTKGLEVCATCKQVVLPIDLRNHLSNHTLETHFPVLSSGTTVNNNNNVWHRK